MIKIVSTLFLLLTATFILSGCAPKVEDNSFSLLTQEQREKKLNDINELEEFGKIGLFSRYKNASFSVNCAYSYSKNKFSLAFTGPMGMQYALIEVYANGTTYINAQGKELKGENARELLKENFKLDIPVEDLHRVMIGLPRGKVIYDNLGYAKEALVEDQYKVIYRSYKPIKEYVLPNQLEIITPQTKIVLRISDITTVK